MTLYKNSRIQAEMDEDDFHEDEQKNIKEATQSEDAVNWQKRYSDQTRWYQDKEAKYKAEIEELRRQNEKIVSGEIRPPKSVAEIEAWEKDYPDFAQIMDQRVERIVETKMKDVKVQTNQLKVERAKNELRKRHPDLDELVAPNSDFMKWLAKQPQKHIDAMTKSLDVDDADFVIDKFKTKVLSKKKVAGGDDFEDTSGAARAVRTKSSAPEIDDNDGQYLYSESQIQKAGDRWWDANSEKVMKAMREGKVLMDITGGAY